MVWAAAAPIPPLQTMATAMALENFEGDVVVRMAVLRLKTDKILTPMLDPTPANGRARGLTTTPPPAIRAGPDPRIPRRPAHRPANRTHRMPAHPGGFAHRSH